MIDVASEADVAAIAAIAGVAVDPIIDERARPLSRFFVARAKVGGPTVAFLHTCHVADEIEIIDIVTDRSHRRHGYARELLEHLIAIAQSESARLIALEVRISNAPAIALYRSLAFSPISTRKSYYSDGEDALDMHLTLRPNRIE